MGIIGFAALCIIDLILLFAHWYLPFFLLSLWLFCAFCWSLYVLAHTPTREERIKALEGLVDYYIEQKRPKNESK